MKQTLKKIMAVLLAVVLTSGLNACSSANETVDTDANTEVEAANGSSSDAAVKESPVTSEEVTLKVLFFEAGFGRKWQEWLKTGFEKKYPNVTVELIGDASLTDTLTPIMEGGVDLPDVVMANGTDWQTWGPQGIFMDLTDFYEEEVSGTGLALKDYMSDSAQDKFYYDLGEENGGKRTYAIPWSSGPMSIVYNANMFEKYGWEYPATWEDFESLCKQIIIDTKGTVAPITYPGIYPNYVRPFIRAWQIQEMGEDKFLNEYKNSTSVDVYSDIAIEHSYEKFLNLYTQGWILEGTQALDHTQVQMEFINEKAAMILNGYWLETEMADAWPEDYKIVMGPVPQGGSIDKPVSYINMPDYIAITAETKVVDVAKEFLRFSTSEEASQQFAVLAGGLRPFQYSLEGIEGVTDFTKSCQDVAANENYYNFTDASGNPLFYALPGNTLIGQVASGELTPAQAADEYEKLAIEYYNTTKQDLGK